MAFHPWFVPQIHSITYSLFGLKQGPAFNWLFFNNLNPTVPPITTYFTLWVSLFTVSLFTLKENFFFTLLSFPSLIFYLTTYLVLYFLSTIKLPYYVYVRQRKYLSLWGHDHGQPHLRAGEKIIFYVFLR